MTEGFRRSRINPEELAGDDASLAAAFGLWNQKEALLVKSKEGKFVAFTPVECHVKEPLKFLTDDATVTSFAEAVEKFSHTQGNDEFTELERKEENGKTIITYQHPTKHGEGHNITYVLDENEELIEIIVGDKASALIPPIKRDEGFETMVLKDGKITDYVKRDPRDANKSLSWSDIATAMKNPRGAALERPPEPARAEEPRERNKAKSSHKKHIEAMVGFKKDGKNRYGIDKKTVEFLLSEAVGYIDKNPKNDDLPKYTLQTAELILEDFFPGKEITEETRAALLTSLKNAIDVIRREIEDKNPEDYVKDPSKNLSQRQGLARMISVFGRLAESYEKAEPKREAEPQKTEEKAADAHEKAAKLKEKKLLKLEKEQKKLKAFLTFDQEGEKNKAGFTKAQLKTAFLKEYTNLNALLLIAINEGTLDQMPADEVFEKCADEALRQISSEFSNASGENLYVGKAHQEAFRTRYIKALKKLYTESQKTLKGAIASDPNFNALAFDETPPFVEEALKKTTFGTFIENMEQLPKATSGLHGLLTLYEFAGSHMKSADEPEFDDLWSRPRSKEVHYSITREDFFPLIYKQRLEEKAQAIEGDQSNKEKVFGNNDNAYLANSLFEEICKSLDPSLFVLKQADKKRGIFKSSKDKRDAIFNHIFSELVELSKNNPEALNDRDSRQQFVEKMQIDARAIALGLPPSGPTRAQVEAQLQTHMRAHISTKDLQLHKDKADFSPLHYVHDEHAKAVSDAAFEIISNLDPVVWKATPEKVNNIYRHVFDEVERLAQENPEKLSNREFLQQLKNHLWRETRAIQTGKDLKPRDAKPDVDTDKAFDELKNNHTDPSKLEAYRKAWKNRINTAIQNGDLKVTGQPSLKQKRDIWNYLHMLDDFADQAKKLNLDKANIDSILDLTKSIDLEKLETAILDPKDAYNYLITRLTARSAERFVSQWNAILKKEVAAISHIDTANLTAEGRKAIRDYLTLVKKLEGYRDRIQEIHKEEESNRAVVAPLLETEIPVLMNLAGSLDIPALEAAAKNYDEQEIAGLDRRIDKNKGLSRWEERALELMSMVKEGQPISEAERKHIHEFVEHAVGNLDLNKRLDKYLTMSSPLINDNLISHIKTLSYKTRNIDRFDEINAKFMVIYSLIVANDIDKIEDNQKLTYQEFGIISNISSLKGLLAEFLDLGFISNSGKLNTLAKTTEDLKTAISSLNLKILDEHQANPGNMYSFHKQKMRDYLAREEKLKDRIKESFMGEYGHMGNIVVDGETNKPSKFHLQIRVTKEKLTQKEISISNFFKVNLEKLVKPDIFQRAQKVFGAQYEEKLMDLYLSAEREINKKFRNASITNDEGRGEVAGVKSILPFGNTRFTKRDLQKIHNNVVSAVYENPKSEKNGEKQYHKMICSEYAIKAFIATALEFEDKLRKELALDEEVSVVDLSSLERERLSSMLPERVIKVLGAAGIIEELPPTPTEALLFKEDAKKLREYHEKRYKDLSKLSDKVDKKTHLSPREEKVLLLIQSRKGGKELQPHERRFVQDFLLHAMNNPDFLTRMGQIHEKMRKFKDQTQPVIPPIDNTLLSEIYALGYNIQQAHRRDPSDPANIANLAAVAPIFKNLNQAGLCEDNKELEYLRDLTNQHANTKGKPQPANLLLSVPQLRQIEAEKRFQDYVEGKDPFGIYALPAQQAVIHMVGALEARFFESENPEIINNIFNHAFELVREAAKDSPEKLENSTFLDDLAARLHNDAVRITRGKDPHPFKEAPDTTPEADAIFEFRKIFQSNEEEKRTEYGERYTTGWDRILKNAFPTHTGASIQAKRDYLSLLHKMDQQIAEMPNDATNWRGRVKSNILNSHRNDLRTIRYISEVNADSQKHIDGLSKKIDSKIGFSPWEAHAMNLMKLHQESGYITNAEKLHVGAFLEHAKGNTDLQKRLANNDKTKAFDFFVVEMLKSYTQLTEKLGDVADIMKRFQRIYTAVKNDTIPAEADRIAKDELTLLHGLKELHGNLRNLMEAGLLGDSDDMARLEVLATKLELGFDEVQEKIGDLSKAPSVAKGQDVMRGRLIKGESERLYNELGKLSKKPNNDTGLSDWERKALRIITKAQNGEVIEPHEKRHAQDFIQYAIGNKELNARLDPLYDKAKLNAAAVDAVANTLIQTLYFFTFKSQISKDISAIAAKAEGLLSKYKNDPNTKFSKEEKLSFKEYGMLNKLAACFKQMEELKNAGLLEGNPELLKRYEQFKVCKDFNDQFILKLREERQLKNGDIVMYDRRKIAEIEGDSISMRDSVASIISDHEHTALIKVVNDSVKISHLWDNKVKDDNLTHKQYMQGDVYRIHPHLAVKDTHISALKSYYGEGWRDIVDNKYREIEQQLLEDPSKFEGIEVTSTGKMIKSGLRDLVPGGHLSEKEKDFKKMHQKLRGGQKYAANQRSPMMCSEFVARITAVAFYELGVFFTNKLKLGKDTNNVIDIPFDSREKFSQIHPGRLEESLERRGVIEKLPRTKTEEQFIADESTTKKTQTHVERLNAQRRILGENGPETKR